MLPATEYYSKGSPDIPSKVKLDDMKTYITDLRILDQSELPKRGEKHAEDEEEIGFGIKFTTYNFFCPKFLAFLKSYLTGLGVTFIRRRLDAIDDAFAFASTSTSKPIVFNCTGLGARTLGGVKDEAVYPTRGQVVVVRAPQIKENMALEGPVFTTYVIPRPFSGGHVVCGGYMQKGSFDGATYGHESASILERVRALLPAIEPFEIVREAAGLRPSRVGGVRIEREIRDNGGHVIHNYGAGGTGYQSGYGMALEAVQLMKAAAVTSKGKL